MFPVIHANDQQKPASVLAESLALVDMGTVNSLAAGLALIDNDRSSMPPGAHHEPRGVCSTKTLWGLKPSLPADAANGDDAGYTWLTPKADGLRCRVFWMRPGLFMWWNPRDGTIAPVLLKDEGLLQALAESSLDQICLEAEWMTWDQLNGCDDADTDIAGPARGCCGGLFVVFDVLCVRFVPRGEQALVSWLDQLCPRTDDGSHLAYALPLRHRARLLESLFPGGTVQPTIAVAGTPGDSRVRLGMKRCREEQAVENPRAPMPPVVHPVVYSVCLDLAGAAEVHGIATKPWAVVGEEAERMLTNVAAGQVPFSWQGHSMQLRVDGVILYDPDQHGSCGTDRSMWSQQELRHAAPHHDRSRPARAACVKIKCSPTVDVRVVPGATTGYVAAAGSRFVKAGHLAPAALASVLTPQEAKMDTVVVECHIGVGPDKQGASPWSADELGAHTRAMRAVDEAHTTEERAAGLADVVLTPYMSRPDKQRPNFITTAIAAVRTAHQIDCHGSFRAFVLSRCGHRERIELRSMDEQQLLGMVHRATCADTDQIDMFFMGKCMEHLEKRFGWTEARYAAELGWEQGLPTTRKKNALSQKP